MASQRHDDRFITAWYCLSNIAVDIGLLAAKDLDKYEMIPRERMPEVYDSVLLDVGKLDTARMHWIWVEDEGRGWRAAYRTPGVPPNFVEKPSRKQ